MGVHSHFEPGEQGRTPFPGTVDLERTILLDKDTTEATVGILKQGEVPDRFFDQAADSANTHWGTVHQWSADDIAYGSEQDLFGYVAARNQLAVVIRTRAHYIPDLSSIETDHVIPDISPQLGVWDIWSPTVDKPRDPQELLRAIAAACPQTLADLTGNYTWERPNGPSQMPTNLDFVDISNSANEGHRVPGAAKALIEYMKALFREDYGLMLPTSHKGIQYASTFTPMDPTRPSREQPGRKLHMGLGALDSEHYQHNARPGHPTPGVQRFFYVANNFRAAPKKDVLRIV